MVKLIPKITKNSDKKSAENSDKKLPKILIRNYQKFWWKITKKYEKKKCENG